MARSEVRTHTRGGSVVRAHSRSSADSTPDTPEGAKEAAKQAAALQAQSTSAEADGDVPLTKGLSPSSASTFRQCPKKWQHKYIDRMPDPPGEPALRGTFVHQVLESLMDEKPSSRTLDTARSACRDLWPHMSADGDFKALSLTEEQERRFRWDAWRNIERYFETEDPASVDVVSTEQDVRAEVDGVPFRGIVDLVERGPNGLRVTDYKTGKAPNPRYLDDRLAQVWLYAAALRESGEDIAEVRLLYLSAASETDFCRPLDKVAMHRATTQHRQTWDNIGAAIAEGEFPPKPGPLCGWCPYRSDCPAGNAEHQRRRGYED